FFCQAEDSIRDRNVTGVQTCALPILNSRQSKCQNRWNHVLKENLCISDHSCLSPLISFSNRILKSSRVSCICFILSQPIISKILFSVFNKGFTHFSA